MHILEDLRENEARNVEGLPGATVRTKNDVEDWLSFEAVALLALLVGEVLGLLDFVGMVEDLTDAHGAIVAESLLITRPSLETFEGSVEVSDPVPAFSRESFPFWIFEVLFCESDPGVGVRHTPQSLGSNDM